MSDKLGKPEFSSVPQTFMISKGVHFGLGLRLDVSLYVSDQAKKECIWTWPETRCIAVYI